MSFDLAYSRTAEKQLTKIPHQTALRILEGCERLKKTPFPDEKHVKKIKGYSGLYRLRVGEYRIVFTISKSIIQIVAVISRQDFQKAY